MCQVFLNAHVYVKQKINLTWPNMAIIHLVKIVKKKKVGSEFMRHQPLK